MEVRPGYKQTEVGVIPEEWDVDSLVDMLDASVTIGYGTAASRHTRTAGRSAIVSENSVDGRIDLDDAPNHADAARS